MRLGEIIEFRKDLYFEGAVQSDWFYDPQKAKQVSENFVFHGKNYFGVDAKKDSIDTISLVKELVLKLGKENSNPRSLFIADYGTGKSHFAVTLAQILSGSDYMPSTYKRILNNIEIIDHETAAVIKHNTKDRNFVIMINGIRDFNLHSEILKATQKSLKLYGLDDSSLKHLNKTIETASRFFDLNSESRLSDFEKAAKNRGWNESGESLVHHLKEAIGSDDDAFEIINDVYELTTGQRIRWEEGISAKSILEMLLSQYCGLNGTFDNVVILFDEFGRFLEYASGTDGGKCGDNALQEIFEVSQNAAGALQIVNFIQTDIKTYLLRVDQSRNLSRYIGRYDESEKYHISSNLETVFANLIARKDKAAFESKIIGWQNKKEDQWQSIFDNLNKWTHTAGIWSDYPKYRKVIVEGIFPLHPISVFMLTQLSDYLQNRSSMNIINKYICDVADDDLKSEPPLIIPSELMCGDLFVEMLAAETSGRHRSDYCIRYENVLKKNETKFDENSKAVLRANLVTRTLRFNTRTYDEAKLSLEMCSGLSSTDVEAALQILVDEYAVMAFDEIGGCFDFTEDAKGAYDYKIMKHRLLSNKSIDIRSMLSMASIMEFGGFDQTQLTNFGTLHRIVTNEWCFTQEVLLAEDLTTDLAKKYLEYWKKSTSVVTPKGRLIWLYVNKDTPYNTIETCQGIVSLFENTPIVVLLLNDTDNKLKNVLTEYDVLDSMDDKTRDAYSSIYVKDREKVTLNLKNTFESLKKNRDLLTTSGVAKLTKRLTIGLTDIFEKLYPEVTPYNFDGLLTSGNNFTGNGIKYYCQILKMFLSNKVNFDTIHDFQIEVRNRIQALFMVEASSSWKCITKECAIISPLNEKARAIYDNVESQLKADEKYDCASFFETYCAPPYGMSEEAGAMFLAMIIDNLWHNIRIDLDGSRTTIIEWKDNIVEDKKLHLDSLKNSLLLWVDTGSIEARFSQLFKRINSNRDLTEAEKLKSEMNSMIEFYGLPDSLEVHKKLADMRFTEFENANHMWKKRISDVEEEINTGIERGDLYKILGSIEMISGISLGEIFTSHNIDITDEYSNQLKDLRRRADAIITDNFPAWVERSVYCRSVDQMNSFEKFYLRCRDLLKAYGYTEFAKLINAKGEKELCSKAEIKSRQELVEDGRKYLSDYNNVKPTNYSEIRTLIRRADDLEERCRKYGAGIGSQAIAIEEKIKEAHAKLQQRKDKMDDDVSSIYDTIAEADSLDSIELAVQCLDTVMGYNLPAADKEEFEALDVMLHNLMSDIQELKDTVNNRERFQDYSERFLIKYSNDDLDYNFRPVIEDCICHIEEVLDMKDARWREENLTLNKKSRRDAFAWKERTEALPAYLSPSTLESIVLMDKEADEIISDGKIEDVIMYFNKLDMDEKSKCLDLLKASL